MNKEIKKNIECINGKYLSLLLRIKEKGITSKNINAIIDEINIFWQIHKRNCLFIFKYLSDYDYDTVVFTGAMGIEIKDHEYEPFLLSGQNRIYDDKLPVYLDVISQPISGKAKQTILDNINYLVNNYVELLQLSLNNIFIVPISFLLLDHNEINDLSNKLFLGLFKNIKSLKEYYKKVVSEQDYQNTIIENVVNMFLLNSANEDANSSIEKIKSTSDFFNLEFSFAQKVHYVLFAAIANAISCVVLASKTGFIPYLRNKVVSHNTIVILSSINVIHKEIERKMPNFIITIILLNLFYQNTNFSEFNSQPNVLDKHMSFLDFLRINAKCLPSTKTFRASFVIPFLERYLEESDIKKYGIKL